MLNRRTVLTALLFLGGKLGFPVARASAQQPEYIPQPAALVPYTWERVMVSGDQRTPSRRYRRSDGSIRTESGPSFDFVDILSIPRQRFFVFAPGAGWREHPMRPQLAPMQLSRARALPVARNDARVAAVASLGTEFEFYEVTGASITQIFCPQLNMMSVWLKDATGRVIETTRVTIGEPATSFEPPPGVAIEQRAEPEGPGRVEGALRRQVVR